MSSLFTNIQNKVFRQIVSFIKGSVEAMSTPNGHLSKSEYINYPFKKCPLSVDKREIAFKLWEKYENMKAEKGDYDACDYIFHIIKQVTCT